MPRIIGVDIPREKRVDVALTYLYGVGKTLSKKVLLEAKVDPAKRAKDLTEAEVSTLTGDYSETTKVEGDLRREIQMNIKRLMDIRCYRGSEALEGPSVPRAKNPYERAYPQREAENRGRTQPESGARA